jgi:hypothetical protein
MANLSMGHPPFYAIAKKENLWNNAVVKLWGHLIEAPLQLLPRGLR